MDAVRALAVVPPVHARSVNVARLTHLFLTDSAIDRSTHLTHMLRTIVLLSSISSCISCKPIQYHTNNDTMYSLQVSAILIAMIVTGAARSVAVQLFFQLGFTQPLFVTLIYLFGQTLALVVYFVSREMDKALQSGPKTSEGTTPIGDSKHPHPTTGDGTEDYIGLGEAVSVPISPLHIIAKGESINIEPIPTDNYDEEYLTNDVEQNKIVPANINAPCPKQSHRRLGSASGLTDESKRAAEWIHRVPYYAKPILPGFFNLCNSAMRWTSLIYVSASVAEMLISGLELVLSVMAARYIRKRMISRARWTGVGFVAMGVVLVGFIDLQSSKAQSPQDEDEESFSLDAKIIGHFLIFGQCIMSVLQDLAEELFMQEAQFPATLLLGMEGFFGLVFGIFCYYPLAPFLGEDPSKSWDLLLGDPKLGWYAVGLSILVTLTGIFNILATSVTSSMTRNVWKNLRTVLVWVFALTLFYTTENDALGEEWIVPQSFYTLAGFSVIITGIYAYYTNT